MRAQDSDAWWRSKLKSVEESSFPGAPGRRGPFDGVSCIGSDCVQWRAAPDTSLLSDRHDLSFHNCLHVSDMSAGTLRQGDTGIY